MTIRRRLTFLYTLLLLGALLLFSLGVYTLLRMSLVQQVDQQLIAREEEFRSELLVGLGQLGLHAEQMEQFLEQYGGVDQLASPGLFINISDPQTGISLASSGAPNLTDEPRTPREGTEIRTIRLDGHPVRILQAPLFVGEPTPATLTVGQPLIFVTQALRRLAVVLGGGTALLTMLGWWLGERAAQRALRPVGEMSQRARLLVESHDLDTRLPVINPEDELGQLALTFNEALEQIALLFAAQRRFVADAAHELRTPLTSIQGYIELLERGAVEDPEVRAEALHVIGAESRRLTRLVNDLLLLIQSEARPLEIVREPVSLLPLVRAVMTQARIVGPDHEWQLQVGAEPVVEGDRDRLHQLLLNLLDNARRYSPVGTTIVIRLDVTANDAVLEVEDEGRGIPAAQLPHLFDPFFRGPEARRLGEGTGLGLAIVARVVAAHGGRVEVTQPEPGGTCFRIYLPLMESEMAA